MMNVPLSDSAGEFVASLTHIIHLELMCFNQDGPERRLCVSIYSENSE